MANEVPNIVKYGNRTIIDLTDTTAIASDVAQGKYFYGADGVKVEGTASGGGEVPVWQGSDDYVYLSDTVNAPAEIYVDDSGYVVLDMPPAVFNLQTKTRTYTPTTSQQTDTITADSGYDGLEEVDITVNAIQTETKSATPSESAQIITPTSGKYLTEVSVGAISSSYVGSNITRRSSSDLTASGATVTVPSGYYSTNATKSVDTMTLPTSASTTRSYTSKATVSRSTSDQYINIPTGFNTAGASYTISATPNGTVTAPSSISGTQATVSTGTNTLTLTKSVSVTPNVTTAGYVSSGTAGNSSVSLTANVTTKSAQTYTPSTSTQTITAGQYLTGAQTINPIPSQYIVPSGNKSITSNGNNIDVAQYSTVSVNVPSSGYDIPVFSSNDGWTTIVCNKTYNECVAQLNVDGNGLAYANFGTSLEPVLVPFIGIRNLTDYSIEYTYYDGSLGSQDIIYRSNGTIVGDGSSLRVETLNVTQNGTYSPTYPNFYGLVNVNVPSSARTCTITNSGASSNLFVKYNNTKYYTANGTFTFSRGDTLYITCTYGDTNALSLNGDYVIQPTLQGSIIDYEFTLPDCDIEISFTKSVGTSYVDITASYLNITSNGNYDVGSYGYAKVNVSGGISGIVKGTLNVPTTVNTSSYVTITNTTAIGFTPTKFIFYKDTATTTNNYIHYLSYSEIGTLYLRNRAVYSGQNGTLSGGTAYTSWNSASSGHLRLDNGNIQVSTTSSYILGAGDYTWIAIE